MPVIIEKEFNASPEKIWKALTDKEQMKQWYFNLDEFRAEPGFEFKFPGKGNTGENYMHHCKVIEVIPLKKLQYSWEYEGLKGYSVVTFELSASGNKTKLRLTHEGLESFPQNNADFAKESFTNGWTQLVTVLLKNFLEA